MLILVLVLCVIVTIPLKLKRAGLSQASMGKLLSSNS